MTDGHNPIQWSDPLPSEQRPARRVRTRTQLRQGTVDVEDVVYRPFDKDGNPLDPSDIDHDALTLGGIISTIVIGTFQIVMGVLWAFFSAIAYLARRFNNH